MDPELLDEPETSVSEACNNVVLHAYNGQPGPMAVQLFVQDDSFLVSFGTIDGFARTHRRRSSTTKPEELGVSVIQRLRMARGASAPGQVRYGSADAIRRASS